MRRVLVFDLGGVLVENKMFEELPTLMGHAVSENELKTKLLRSPALRAFELGESTPRAFADAMVGEFGLTTSPDEFLKAFSGWPKGFHPNAQGFLSDIRKRYLTACLSNSNELHWTDNVTSQFDHCYSSHLVKRIKPDFAVFEYVTNDLGCDPSDVVFFDDSQLNVDAAQNFGWEAHLTTGYSELCRVMSDLGLIR